MHATLQDLFAPDNIAKRSVDALEDEELPCWLCDLRSSGICGRTRDVVKNRSEEFRQVEHLLRGGD